MLLTGYIDEDLNTHLNEVDIITKLGEKILIEATLDTGFNDYFSMPRKFKEQCELVFIGDETSILADGSIITDKSYKGEIILGTEKLTVTIFLTDDDEGLVGNGLLDDKIVMLNFKNHTIAITD